MPTLVYFNIQGKVQATRYLLEHKGVQYEDIRLTPEEWAVAKQAGTYTDPGAALPSFIEDDGTKRNQSAAILHLLCARHGVVPQSPEEQYEMRWYFETCTDYEAG